jgi:hypothetical protein
MSKSVALAVLALGTFGLSMCATPVHQGSPSATPASPLRHDSHYEWKHVAIGGGGFVTGIIVNPTERHLVYLRTDVGGAYRRDAASEAWVPLLDWVSAPDWNLHGIESLATDPIEPARVYLAAGTYTNPDVKNGEMLRSADYGRTWKRTAMPFKMGGNEAGRGSGERLAIDPRKNSILFFGSRRDGLWTSENFGETFARVASFPEVPDDSALHQNDTAPGGFNYLAQAVGIVFVLFDPANAPAAGPTPTLYVAVSTARTSLFRSTDAGASWQSVPQQPTGFRPTHAALSPDGAIYLTYADEPGPNRMRDGAVYRFEPKTGVFTNITPEKPLPPDHRFGYAAVSVDVSHPSTVVVTTWNRGQPFDEIYRSNDRGSTWSPIMKTAQWDHASAPYTKEMHHHWMCDVEFDPFDSDRMTFTTGFGIWTTTNARATDAQKPVLWSFDDRGIEETVPLALVSPPEGAHLLSGLGDIDGFRHDDLDASPERKFDAPGFKNTEWIDFAASSPSVLARSGTTYGHDRILGAYSLDGGSHWTAFASQPPPHDDARAFPTGPIAISADGASIVWTTRGNAPYVTRDRGNTWKKVEGAPADLRMVGDRVNASRWYGYDTEQGIFYAGTADTLGPALSGLPTVPNRRWGPAYADLVAVPNRQGEMWLALDKQLLRFTASGGAMMRVPAAEDVTAVGFGKPRVDGEYPAVFVAGSVGGVYGIHRSDDGGATFVPITDAAHQFGSISHLAGDPRIFGRIYAASGGRGIVYGSLVP